MSCVRPSVCPSHPAAARRRYRFAAVGLVGMRYKSLATRLLCTEANAGSVALSAYVVAEHRLVFSALTLLAGQQEWVCWHGYLSGARCRLAYGPADATATQCLLLQ